MSNSSPVILGDLIYVSTSNGQDEEPRPHSVAESASHHRRQQEHGKLVWEDNSVQDRILHGQWSTPSVGKIGGVDQVVSAQGDGWVRGYETLTGRNCGPRHESQGLGVAENPQRDDRDARHLRRQGLHRQRSGPRARRGRRPPLCPIDGTKRGDITQTGRVWHYDKIRRSISTAAIADGLLYIPDFSGFLHCLDAKTAGLLDARYVRGRVGIDARRGRPGLPRRRGWRRRRDAGGQGEEVLAEMNMGSAVYATPVPPTAPCS
jgi:hypothetical protein